MRLPMDFDRSAEQNAIIAIATRISISVKPLAPFFITAYWKRKEVRSTISFFCRSPHRTVTITSLTDGRGVSL